MNAETFRAASVAAEESLDYLLTAQALAAKGDQPGALKCLKAINAPLLMYGDTLAATEDDLAAEVTVQVAQHRPTESLYFSSVHQAVRSLWMTISVLAEQDGFAVPPDLCDWLGINISQLRACLQQERAKLLAQPPDSGQQSPATKKRPKGKPGRKGDPDKDKQILEEFEAGKRDGLWETQTEFVRKQYPELSPEWFTQLKNRVNRRRQAVKKSHRS